MRLQRALDRIDVLQLNFVVAARVWSISMKVPSNRKNEGSVDEQVADLRKELELPLSAILPRKKPHSLVPRRKRQRSDTQAMLHHPLQILPDLAGFAREWRYAASWHREHRRK